MNFWFLPLEISFMGLQTNKLRVECFLFSFDMSSEVPRVCIMTCVNIVTRQGELELWDLIL